MSKVAEWRLQENSGVTAFDDSGSNDGTSANTIVRDDGGMLFNGTSDFITVTDDAAINFAGEFTVSVDANFAVSGGIQRLVYKVDTGDGYHITKIADDTMEFVTFVFGQVTSTLVSDAAVPIGELTNFTMTRDGSNVTRCYINGIQQASTGSIVGDTTNVGDLFIGQIATGGQFMNGTISCIQMHNEALSANEIFSISQPNMETAPFGYTTKIRKI